MVHEAGSAVSRPCRGASDAGRYPGAQRVVCPPPAAPDAVPWQHWTPARPEKFHARTRDRQQELLVVVAATLVPAENPRPAVHRDPYCAVRTRVGHRARRRRAGRQGAGAARRAGDRVGVARDLRIRGRTSAAGVAGRSGDARPCAQHRARDARGFPGPAQRVSAELPGTPRRRDGLGRGSARHRPRAGPLAGMLVPLGERRPVAVWRVFDCGRDVRPGRQPLRDLWHRQRRPRRRLCRARAREPGAARVAGRGRSGDRGRRARRNRPATLSCFCRSRPGARIPGLARPRCLPSGNRQCPALRITAR